MRVQISIKIYRPVLLNKKNLQLIPAFLATCMIACVSREKAGEKIARKYCATCHQFPEPTLLNRKTWANYVLPAMGPMIGFRHLPSGGYVEYHQDRQLTLKDWNLLANYYITASPVVLEKPTAPVSIEPFLKQFDLHLPASSSAKPSTTCVFIHRNERRFSFADGSTGKLYTADDEGNLADSLQGEKGIVQIWEGVNDDKGNAGVMVLSMGVLYPSDERAGKLIFYNRSAQSSTILIDSLQRPVHASFADMNSDGRKDVVIAEFGNKKGKLSWYEQLADGKYQQHVLNALPGAVKIFTGDFNGDKRPDILCLMAQGNEGVFVYYGDKKNGFRQEQLTGFPPSYGCNSMDVTDIDQDGDADLVITNGDNGDYPPILKPYHGIRIFINDGHFHFKEQLFLPVNGVGKVITADFDGDGDVDMASIAYFPDFDDKPEEAFIYWENRGALSFRAHTFDNASIGRWLTMDGADMDGDGDTDIILGNAYFTLGYLPETLKQKWDRNSPPVIILKNTLH